MTLIFQHPVFSFLVLVVVLQFVYGVAEKWLDR
jgi:hypothetical protein